MGPFAYYSPLMVGFVFGLLTTGSFWPEVASAEPFPKAVWHALQGLVFGLIGQLGMFGAQGVWAQVLPVPVGRSIRGGVAVLGGGALLAALVASLAAALLMMQELSLPGTVALTIAGAFWLVTLGSYAWGWPVAQRDFVDAD